RAQVRIRKAGWKNVQVVDREYGWNAITRGGANAVLFSYSLSMIPSWQAALKCSHEELAAGGRISVVDFCARPDKQTARAFAKRGARNLVGATRPQIEALEQACRTRMLTCHRRPFPYIGTI